jgi:hypothetical protein
MTNFLYKIFQNIGDKKIYLKRIHNEVALIDDLSDKKKCYCEPRVPSVNSYVAFKKY